MIREEQRVALLALLADFIKHNPSKRLSETTVFELRGYMIGYVRGVRRGWAIRSRT